jgi:hypothetical protein
MVTRSAGSSRSVPSQELKPLKKHIYKEHFLRDLPDDVNKKLLENDEQRSNSELRNYVYILRPILDHLDVIDDYLDSLKFTQTWEQHNKVNCIQPIQEDLINGNTLIDKDKSYEVLKQIMLAARYMLTQSAINENE